MAEEIFTSRAEYFGIIKYINNYNLLDKKSQEDSNNKRHFEIDDHNINIESRFV